MYSILCYSILFYTILYYSILFYSILFASRVRPLYITYEVLLIIYNEPGVIPVHRLHMGLYPLYKPGGNTCVSITYGALLIIYNELKGITRISILSGGYIHFYVMSQGLYLYIGYIWDYIQYTYQGPFLYIDYISYFTHYI